MNLFTHIVQQTKAIVPAIALVILMLPFSSQAQFVVKQNTTFTVKNDVSSKASENIFDATINGEGTIILNGEDQTLYMGNDLTIPNLTLTNASQLQITSAIHIKGNLILEAGTLVLNHPLKVDGAIKKTKKARIQNDYWIHQNKTQIIAHKGITAYKTNTFSPVAIVSMPNETFGLVTVLQQNMTTLLPLVYKTIYTSLIKPPPRKVRC